MGCGSSWANPNPSPNLNPSPNPNPNPNPNLNQVGRAVMARPWHWATVDTALYGEASNPARSRRELLHAYAAFAEQQEARLPQRLRRVLLSPCLNLFAGEPMGTLPLTLTLTAP